LAAGSGPGNAHRIDGITIYVVNSVHSAGIQVAPGEPRIYGGIAVGYVVVFENGYSLYFSGSSAATMDMALWGELYKPDGAILHQSAAHDPKDAALVARLIGANNPNFRTVFPHHHRLQLRPGELFRAADLRAEIENLGIPVTFIEPEPRRTYTLSK